MKRYPYKEEENYTFNDIPYVYNHNDMARMSNNPINVDIELRKTNGKEANIIHVKCACDLTWEECQRGPVSSYNWFTAQVLIFNLYTKGEKIEMRPYNIDERYLDIYNGIVERDKNKT